MKKVALFHPYKHHSYYSLKGIAQYTNKVIGVYGYYYKDDILDKLVLKSKHKKKIEGYEDKQISDSIKTSLLVKGLYLLNKFIPTKFKSLYFKGFQRWSKKFIKQNEVIHVLQDYLNETVRWAYEQKKIIVYEHIQPFASYQKEKLMEEIVKFNYPKEYADVKFPDEMIEKQIENIKMSNIIIVASQATYNSLLPYVNEEKLRLIPYGSIISNSNIDEIKNRIKHKKTTDALRILYVGAFNLTKGVQYIIEAAKQLVGENIEFTFIGKPTFEQDKVLVNAVRNLSNAKYIESVPHVEMYKQYCAHDIFVFEALFEGFGMVTLEAMTYGLPCIVADGGKGVIVHGEDGYVHPNGDVNALVNYIKYLNKEREVLKKMGEKAFQNVQNYTWKRYENEIEKIYLELEKL
ncbi:Glycosyl transferases group 1 [Paenibacillus catalpae]|uniref:Glycosyl transferases group 1 n=1 Tax=Paenibacillus catalpae TaxID=1045775 RepID=A0A1I2DTZ1_9BACL|nr:glycosyltransferase family 4 protein [Paenibacillus catalpae]SFE84045.1 Glycosyl transferases group 1 [Paenibacillus catalpae]